MSDDHNSMAEVIDEPDSLRLLCIHLCIKQPEHTLGVVDPVSGYLVLREGLVLPQVVCSDLVDEYRPLGKPLSNRFLNLFQDTQRTRLRRLDLTDSDVTDDVLAGLCNHNLQELNLYGCSNLTSKCIQHINKTAKTLQVLHFGDSSQILSSEEFAKEFFKACEEPHPHPGQPAYGHDFIVNAQDLKVFSVRNLKCPGVNDIVGKLLSPLRKLQFLDLADCEIAVEDLTCFDNLAETLKSLVLHNVKLHKLEESFENISKLKQLRHLDLSLAALGTAPRSYYDPSHKVRKLVRSLPNLVSMDVSCSSLASTGLEKPFIDEKGDSQENGVIPGLEGRHFEFLGLLRCSDSACYRQNIPADKVTGEANSHQLLCSVQAYIDRPELLLTSTDNLFSNLRYEQQGQPNFPIEKSKEMLVAIIDALERYPNHREITNYASGSLLFFVMHPESILSNTRELYGVKMVRRIVRCILNAMENFGQDGDILRNCCINLSQLALPADVRFEYRRTTELVLRVLDEPPQDRVFMMQFFAFILNMLSCKVPREDKLLIGDLNGVQILLKLIREQLATKVFDEILMLAWSTIWNITDDILVACERFFALNGMQLFLECLATFDNIDLRLAMMGLMSNLAEWKEMRCQLMQPQFIGKFIEMLDATDSFEVSYSAACVFSNMMYDGEEAWTDTEHGRDGVAVKVVEAIERWEMSTKLVINYRSLGPMLRLAACYTAPVAQHWAIWAMCNLSKINPYKYCPMLAKEKGIKLLQEVLESDKPSEGAKTVAKMLLDHYARFEEGSIPKIKYEPVVRELGAP